VIVLLAIIIQARLKCFRYVYLLVKISFSNLTIRSSGYQFLASFIKRYFPCPEFCRQSHFHAFSSKFGLGLLSERRFLAVCHFDHFLRLISAKHHFQFTCGIRDFSLH
jgi:hypothetical protein